MHIVDFVKYEDKSTPSFFLDNGYATTLISIIEMKIKYCKLGIRKMINCINIYVIEFYYTM